MPLGMGNYPGHAPDFRFLFKGDHCVDSWPPSGSLRLEILLAKRTTAFQICGVGQSRVFLPWGVQLRRFFALGMWMQGLSL